MPPTARLLTVVIPVYNEEECIPALFARLVELRGRLAGEIEVELLFVDDGSRDRSLGLLTALAETHRFVKLVALSRNFGHQLAVTAGIDHAAGDWVALMDADLQDPPEAIADMFRLAQQGYDVVYGQRRSRKGDSAFKKVTAAAFYRLIGVLADVDIPKDTGDFGVMSRRVVATLQKMRERHRFLRGMVPWTGFRSIAHQYDRDERLAGETKYPFTKMAGFAANAIFSFSAKPLAIATKLGLVTALLGAAGGLYMLYLKLFTDIPVAGLTSILVSIVFFGGVQVSLIGLLGEYVARIFEEAKGRPLYVVSDTRNL
jgi:dolichol-phosphate mannosyltransferase